MRPWLEIDADPVVWAPAINIWSDAQGLGGALTNMSERARAKFKQNTILFDRVTRNP